MRDLTKTLPLTGALAKALEAEGFVLPLEAREMRIEISGFDNPFLLHYVCNITANDLVAIGKAFARVGTEALDEDAKANWPPGANR
jgi:hypothetical protein